MRKDHFLIIPLLSLFGLTGQYVSADEVEPSISTNPRIDPSHPPHVGSAFYPKLARVLGEQGRCEVEVTIEADGSVSASRIAKSAKSTRLDAACLAAFSADVRFFPATLNGKPVQIKRVIPVVWCLHEGSCEHLR